MTFLRLLGDTLGNFQEASLVKIRLPLAAQEEQRYMTISEQECVDVGEAAEWNKYSDMIHRYYHGWIHIDEVI